MKLLQNRKALSPVIAAMLLIAVTVLCAIAVATWMGAIEFIIISGRATDTSHFYLNQTNILEAANFTIFFADSFSSYAPKLVCDSFDVFLAYTQKYDVDYVVTDYQEARLPMIYQNEETTTYLKYRFWFFVTFSSIDNVAVVYEGYETAWIGDD